MSFFEPSGSGFEIAKPKYKVLQNLGPNMEIRRYEATKWVSTSIQGEADPYKSDYQNKMFFNLFNYISGENVNREKIAMTSPVTVVYNSNNTSRQNSNVKMTMGFFVPHEKQANTPRPTNNDNFLRSEPEMIVAVIKFGGFASTDDFLVHREILIRALGEEAKKYDTANMVTARYDPPFKQINRTNEVWLRKVY